MAIFKRMLSSTPTRKTSSAAVSFLDPLDASSELEMVSVGPDVAPLCWYPYKNLRREMLRLVVFSGQGGKLAYDTDTVISTKDRLVAGSRKSSCGRFQFLPHSLDVSQISKMLFGTMGTSMKADSLKIHTLAQTDSLMISRVFSVPKGKKSASPARDYHRCMASSMSSDSDSQSHYCTIRSLDAIRNSSRRKTQSKTSSYSNTDPPEGFTRLRNSSLQLDGRETTLMEELKAFSPNRLSRARRRQLSLKGLCEDGSSLFMRSRSRLSSCSSIYEANNPATEGEVKQYGFALMFPGEDKDFVFQHILQLEKEIFRLVAQIHRAVGAGGSEFFQLVYEGWTEFCSSICLLHNALRLRTPVWLSLTNPLLQESAANEFCLVLTKLSDQLNTKNTKFFLSTLLSSVLMNHLAWVASVAPPESCSYDRSLLLGTSVIDSRRNPYNAMMAQFMELSGGVGIGNQFAKIVVLGENARLVAEILFVLSYFIRCSSVESKRKEAELMTPESLSPLKSFAEDSSLEMGIAVAAGSPSFLVDKKQEEGMSSPIALAKNQEPSEMICSSYDRTQGDCMTPPPSKTRALVFPTPTKRSLLPKQESTSLRHFELTLDVKELTSSSFGSTNGKDKNIAGTAAVVATSPSTQSSSEANFERVSSTGDFGRSLLAGVCSAYSSHFALSGIDKRQANMEETLLAIHEDVKHPSAEPCTSNAVLNQQVLSPSSSAIVALSASSCQRSTLSQQFSMGPAPTTAHSQPPPRSIPTIVSSQRLSQDSMSPPVPPLPQPDEKLKAVVVVADCDRHIVRIVSSQNCLVEDTQVFSPSEAVASMLEEFVELQRHGCAPTFLISFIEDRLGSLLAKSNVLVRLVSTSADEKPPSSTFKTMTNHEDVEMINQEEPQQEDEEEDEEDPSSLSDTSTHTTSHQKGDLLAFIKNGEAQQECQLEGCPSGGSGKNEDEVISMERVSTILGCHCSDLRLIINVAAVYSPVILSSVV